MNNVLICDWKQTKCGCTNSSVHIFLFKPYPKLEPVQLSRWVAHKNEEKWFFAFAWECKSTLRAGALRRLADSHKECSHPEICHITGHNSAWGQFLKRLASTHKLKVTNKGSTSSFNPLTAALSPEWYGYLLTTHMCVAPVHAHTQPSLLSTHIGVAHDSEDQKESQL